MEQKMSLHISLNNTNTKCKDECPKTSDTREPGRGENAALLMLSIDFCWKSLFFLVVFWRAKESQCNVVSPFLSLSPSLSPSLTIFSCCRWPPPLIVTRIQRPSPAMITDNSTTTNVESSIKTFFKNCYCCCCSCCCSNNPRPKGEKGEKEGEGSNYHPSNQVFEEKVPLPSPGKELSRIGRISWIQSTLPPSASSSQQLFQEGEKEGEESERIKSQLTCDLHHFKSSQFLF